jgi:anti-sigma B factor antagonist
LCDNVSTFLRSVRANPLREPWGTEMEITKRKVGNVAILDLNGKLTIGKGDVVLRETLVEEFENGGKQVLINLDAVGTIDSSGLGELIRSKVTATSNQAEVKLLHVNIKARKLLTMAQLMGVFEMFDDEALAIASFSE